MTAPGPPASAAALALGQPVAPERKPFLLITALTLALFGVSMARLTPVSATLAIRVAEVAPLQKTGLLSLLFMVAGLLGMIASPLAGRLSDRTTFRMGRRMPWIVGGTIVGVASLALMVIVPSVPLLFTGWCLSTLGFAAATTAISAMVLDQVPLERRGMAFGLLAGMSPTAGALSGVFLVRFLPTSLLMFLVPCVFALVGILLLTAIVTDSPGDRTALQPFSLKDIAGAYWINPVAHSDLGLALLSRVLFYFAVLSFTLYNVYFLTDRLGQAATDVPGNVFLLVSAVSFTSVVISSAAGFVSDRLRRRKIFAVMASVCVAAALAGVAFATSFPVVLTYAAVIGAGLGIYSAVGMALFTELLPKSAGAGKGVGIAYVGSSLPSTLLPAAGAVILNVGEGPNFGLLFAAGALAALASAASLLRITSVR